jgi:hypothetical protein
MLRKSSDAMWRGYVATPWCLAEFGSFEVCKKYGPELLKQGPSKDDRKKWLQDNVTDESVGGDSVKWRQGHSPVQRIMVVLPALIVIVIFAVLVLSLAFASIASLLGALMLLVAGVFFACLWVIPGRPREWGVRWFDQLVGLFSRSSRHWFSAACWSSKSPPHRCSAYTGGRRPPACRSPRPSWRSASARSLNRSWA